MSQIASRRSFLVAGLAVVCGCLGNDDPDGTEDAVDDDPDPEDTTADRDDAPEAIVDEWLRGVANFDEIHDHRGTDDVTIQVGAVEDAPQPFVFEPAAIRIDIGTTVVWEWVDSIDHSVTEQDRAFDSGVQNGGEFTHQFEAAGTYRYYCGPHFGHGHLGAVIVE